MWSGTIDFVKRHRKKFVATAVVSGAVVILGKYTESRLREWQEKESRALLEKTRKEHHFETTERMAIRILQSLCRSLRQSIDHHLDSNQIVLDLRRDDCTGDEKIAKWNELKCLAISKCVAYVVCVVQLSILVRVQLHILGGYLYVDTVSGSGIQDHGLTPQTQESFLRLSHAFINLHLGSIVDVVNSTVKKRIDKISLKQVVAPPDVDIILRQILQDCKDNPTLSLSELLRRESTDVPDSLDSAERQCLIKLHANVTDIVDNYDLQEIVAGGFDHAADGLLGHISEACNTTKSGQRAVPLAKVVPVLNGFLSKDDDDGDRNNNDLPRRTLPVWIRIVTSSSTKRFAANVYEAFAQMADSGKKQDSVGFSSSSFSVQEFIQRFASW